MDMAAQTARAENGSPGEESVSMRATPLIAATVARHGRTASPTLFGSTPAGVLP